MALDGTLFTSNVLCFMADAVPTPGPEEAMKFKADHLLYLVDLTALVQVAHVTPVARTRAREVMAYLRREATKRLAICLPKIPSMGRVVFQLVCSEPKFAFTAMGSMVELGKVMHLGGGCAQRAERAATFIDGLYERACRMMKVREAMFLDTVGVVQTDIESPGKEQDRLVTEIEDYLFDHGALDQDLPMCLQLRVLLQPDKAPGRFRRFVKAAAVGLEAFLKGGTPACKEAFEFYHALAKSHEFNGP